MAAIDLYDSGMRLVPYISSTTIGVRPFSRFLLITLFSALIPVVTVLPAYAQNSSTAVPVGGSAALGVGDATSLNAANAQAAYPSSGGATTANTTNNQSTSNNGSSANNALSALPITNSPSMPVMPSQQQLPPPGSAGGIQIPTPPPPSAFTNDANQLAVQAEQAAAQAQAQADIEAQKREQEHNVKSFDKAQMGLLPLAPDQVRGFMNRLEQTQNAAQFPYEGTPKGETRISTLSLDPGTVPPQVNLATGYVTTITMVDVTGEPWPILDVGVGGNFEVSPTQAGSHVVRVMPLTRVGTGDLSVLLKDLPTPVIFRLSAGGPNVDLRYDARVAKLGPNAKAPLINKQHLEAGDETLTLVLENAPPNAAQKLKVSGLDERTKAWAIGDKTYLRTPLALLSPAWNASIASGDGTNVYEIGNAPVLLMSDNGAMIRAQILRDDDHDK